MGSEYLRDIPIEWSSAPISEVVVELVSGDWGKESSDDGLVECDVIRGTDFPLVQEGRYGNVPKRWIRPHSTKKRAVQSGHLLVEMSGGSKAQQTGRVLLMTSENVPKHSTVVFSNFVKRLSVDAEIVDPEFTFWYWKHLYQLQRMLPYEKRTTGIRNFKLSDFLESEQIAIPPLPEQRAIAHVLRTVQRAREATERVIAAARELKQSLLRHLFTYGPVPFHKTDRVELQESEIGDVPGDWVLARIDDISTLVQYGISKRGEQSGAVVILRMANLIDGRLDMRSLQFVDLDRPELEKFRLKSGDILFNRTNSFELVGKTSLFDDDRTCVAASYLIRVVLAEDQVVPAFLNYHMNRDETQMRLKQLAVRAVSQSNINATKLKGVAVPLPDKSTQVAIVEQVDAVDRKLDSLNAGRTAYVALFDSLLHELMTGRVRVHNLDLDLEPEGG